MSKTLFHLASLSGRPSKEDYSLQNSKIRLSNQKILKLGDYEKLLELDSYESSIKILQEQFKFPLDSQITVQENCTKNYKTIIYDLIKSIDSYSNYNKPKFLSNYFLLTQDFFNIKLLLKAKYSEISFDKLNFSFMGFCNMDRLSLIYNEMPLGFIHPIIAESLKNFCQNYSKSWTPYDIDIFWDQELYKTYYSLLESLDSEILLTLYRTQVDIRNILTTLRMKHSNKELSLLMGSIIPNGFLSKIDLNTIFVNESSSIINSLDYLTYNKEIRMGLEKYQETHNLNLLEKSLELYLLKTYDRMVILTEGQDLAIVYALLKKNELSNIQIILSGKLNNLDKHWLLSQIRVVK